MTLLVLAGVGVGLFTLAQLMDATTELLKFQTADPLLNFLKWAVMAALFILALAGPIMAYIRKLNADAAANARDRAESELYLQLQEQIKRSADDIRELVREKNRLFELATRLSAEADAMRERLNKLDTVEHLLSAKERENALLREQNDKLNERVHQLEVTLAKAGISDGGANVAAA